MIKGRNGANFPYDIIEEYEKRGRKINELYMEEQGLRSCLCLFSITWTSEIRSSTK